VCSSRPLGSVVESKLFVLALVLDSAPDPATVSTHEHNFLIRKFNGSLYLKRPIN
jgi:hypothetical protein